MSHSSLSQKPPTTRRVRSRAKCNWNSLSRCTGEHESEFARKQRGTQTHKGWTEESCNMSERSEREKLNRTFTHSQTTQTFTHWNRTKDPPRRLMKYWTWILLPGEALEITKTFEHNLNTYITRSTSYGREWTQKATLGAVEKWNRQGLRVSWTEHAWRT